jgi:Na+-transporting NADH:ubiquinone oxidoreductase subunit C
LPNESPIKAVIMTLLVCIFASVIVAGSAVLLRPKQIANRQLAKEQQIAEILQGATLDGQAPRVFDAGDLQIRVVELATGDYADEIDPATFDARRAVRDPAQSIEVPAALDMAQIKRRTKYAVIHLLIRDGKPQLVVLPVHGLGFGSMLYGYVGLTGDTNRVVGLGFYEHGETPGLGAMIDDPAWRQLWIGKKVWAPGGEVGLGVGRGPVVAGTAEAESHVDGITGATWTGQGVTNLLRYWLGEHGFGLYLSKLRRSAR